MKDRDLLLLMTSSIESLVAARGKPKFNDQLNILKDLAATARHDEEERHKAGGIAGVLAGQRSREAEQWAKDIAEAERLGVSVAHIRTFDMFAGYEPD